MEKITSKQNARVKAWAKLATKKGREASGTYLLDGWHLVQEALNHKAKLHAIIVTDELLAEHEEDFPLGVPVFVVPTDIAKLIGDTVTPQGIFAEVTLPEKTFDPSYVHDGAWLLLDAIQDPGNIGTMVRTADAAGFRGVVLGDGSADVFGPKVVRAMQGSQFHLEVLKGDLTTWTDALQANNIPVYGSELNPEAKNYREIDPTLDFALIMGNEGQGMDAELASKTTANLYIPITGDAESLNVGVAAGVLMFALKL
ncbi:RNA methyltransferase [Periweissella fabaria]|uniref:23S rRNA (Guanosine-2'-O-)-methyltransferase RlmB n=1 Tax=Periweissella fabaria TaxID=546157 RepID=A0ABN8BF29_9LACO|nr:RNA methyltransferase [Periweissella fabaria]MCM0596724.1 RNA methyltransferase [Periweissella fabaria]CAH0416350.1 23S rRNA (guanosine-2'-O-)-methyltransferase RlmB [Periweissella fabaria]